MLLQKVRSTDDPVTIVTSLVLNLNVFEAFLIYCTLINVKYFSESSCRVS